MSQCENQINQLKTQINDLKQTNYLNQYGQSEQLQQFNDLVRQASDAITCNPECQRQRESEKLQKIYMNAKANVVTAPSEETVAYKNYVVFTDGEPAYNQYLDDKLREKAEVITDKFNENFNNEVRKINSQIYIYDGLTANFKNVVDLFKKYRRENKELFHELKDETNDVHTNERKTYYENQNIDNLKFYYFYFLLSIYVICVVCFGVFSLIYPSTSSWKMRLLIFVLLIALPFLSTWILGTILFILYELYNLLPKNVYIQKNY